MTLFFQFLALLFGIVAMAIGGTKGYFLNLSIVVLLFFSQKIFGLDKIILVVVLSLAIYLLAKYINTLANKKYDPLPIREMIFGGSALSLLLGMVLRPIFAGAAIAPVLVVPTLRRFIKLGGKAILLTFGGFLIRFFYSLMLNVYVIFQLLKQ